MLSEVILTPENLEKDDLTVSTEVVLVELSSVVSVLSSVSVEVSPGIESFSTTESGESSVESSVEQAIKIKNRNEKVAPRTVTLLYLERLKYNPIKAKRQRIRKITSPPFCFDIFNILGLRFNFEFKLTHKLTLTRN